MTLRWQPPKFVTPCANIQNAKPQEQHLFNNNEIPKTCNVFRKRREILLKKNSAIFCFNHKITITQLCYLGLYTKISAHKLFYRRRKKTKIIKYNLSVIKMQTKCNHVDEINK